MNSGATPLHPTRDVQRLCPGYPRCICYPPRSHLVAISVLRSPVTVLWCLCSRDPHVTVKWCHNAMSLFSVHPVWHCTISHHSKKGKYDTVGYFDGDREKYPQDFNYSILLESFYFTIRLLLCCLWSRKPAFYCAWTPLYLVRQRVPLENASQCRNTQTTEQNTPGPAAQEEAAVPSYAVPCPLQGPLPAAPRWTGLGVPPHCAA